MSAALVRARAPGGRVKPDELAVPAAFVVPGREDENTSRFDDDEWDFACTVGQRKEPHLQRISFSDFDPSIRTFLKECIYFFSRRAFHVDQGRGKLMPMAPASWRFACRLLRDLVSFAADHGHRLDEIEQDLLDRFVGRYAHVTPHHRIKIRSILRRLYLCGPDLSVSVFDFDPWDGVPATRLEPGIDHGHRHNQTPRIPAAVLRPLLQWASFYLDVARHDLAAFWAANTEHHALTSARAARNLPSTHGHRAAIDADCHSMAAYLAKRAEAGLGLPYDGDRPCWSEIARFSHVPKIRSRPIRLLLDAHVERYGRAEAGTSMAWTALPGTTVPWRPPLRHSGEWRAEIRHLYAAAFIVISYLSGMRPDEVAALQTDCVIIEPGGGERPPRYKLRAATFKNQPPGGVERDWVVIEPVVRAVEVLAGCGKTWCCGAFPHRSKPSEALGEGLQAANPAGFPGVRRFEADSGPRHAAAMSLGSLTRL